MTTITARGAATAYAPMEQTARDELERLEREQQAALLDAFACPTRLHILRLLADYAGTLDVRELEERMNEQGCALAQPTISHHLRILFHAGIVGYHKDKLHVYYSVNQSALEAAQVVIASFGRRA